MLYVYLINFFRLNLKITKVALFNHNLKYDIESELHTQPAKLIALLEHGKFRAEHYP